MKKIAKQLLIMFLTIFLIKFILSLLIKSPSIFGDEYGYAKMARSFFYLGQISVHNIPSSFYPPLYPIILSISYLFKNMNLVYISFKFLNSILSTLILIPAYLLAREFFSEKKSLLISLIIGIFPANFSIVPYIMSENLFYPLFLFSIYFIYKSFTNNELKWDILSGLFIGLTVLTKVSGLVLVLSTIIIFLYKIYKKQFNEIKKKPFAAAMFIITILPWAIRNKIVFNANIFSTKILIGGYSKAINSNAIFNLPGFFTWILLYLSFLVLASGIVYFIFNIHLISYRKEIKDKKLIFILLSLITIILEIILNAYLAAGSISKGYPSIIPWITGRPIGRYIDVVLPLIILNGFIGFEYFNNKIKKKFTLPFIGTGILLLIGTQLTLFPLFPLNNQSLTSIGLLKYIIEFLILRKTSFDIILNYYSIIIISVLFISMLCLIYYMMIKNKMSIKKIIYLLLIFFILTSIVNLGITAYNSKTNWYDKEQMQLGIYFNSLNPNVNDVVLFDIRDCTGKITTEDQNSSLCNVDDSLTIAGFWMNSNIKIDSVNDLNGINYVISKHKLDLEILKSTKNGIYLYKV